MKRLSGFIFFASFVALYIGCRKAPVYPNEPIIKYKDYIVSGADSLQVVFTFTDGDGDVGLSPISTDTNFVMTTYHKNSLGNWVVIDDPNTPSTTDSLMYKYKIPKLTAGQNGLEGKIYVMINRAVLQAVGEDTLQFNAFLLDNSRHKSGVVRTGDIDITHPHAEGQ